MTEEERADRRSLLIVTGILGGVLALGVCWVGAALWKSFGEPTAPAGDDRRRVMLLIDGLRGDVLGHPDRPLPFLDELAAEGRALEGVRIEAASTTAAVASFLVEPRFFSSPLGLRSPAEIGFHRLPESFPVRAEAERRKGRRTVAIVQGRGVALSTNGLARGFDQWTPVERGASVLELAAETLAASKSLFLVVQFALDEPAPTERILELLPERTNRFGDERAFVEDVLEQSFESDAERVDAIDARLGRRRGTEAWKAWGNLRYHAALVELDADLRDFAESLDAHDELSIAGTRGRFVTESRPEKDRWSVSDALALVPVVVRPANSTLAPVVEPRSESETIEFESTAPFEIEVREVRDARRSVRLDRESSGRLEPSDPRAPLRIELESWNDRWLLELGLVVSDEAAVPLGASACPWIPAPDAPSFETEDWSIDVVRKGREWLVRAGDSDLVVYLAAYPWRPEQDPIGEGLLPGATVFELEAGSGQSVVLSAGTRPALFARHADGRPVAPSTIRLEGRHLFDEQAAFLVLPWWPGRRDWFDAEVPVVDPSRVSDFPATLRLTRPDLGPTIDGPLGLSKRDVETLRRLPDDA